MTIDNGPPVLLAGSCGWCGLSFWLPGFGRFHHVQMLVLWACDLVHLPHTFVGQGFCLWDVPTTNVRCLRGGGTHAVMLSFVF